MLNRLSKGHEERKDYPEVTPKAMSDFICAVCGKSFQNQDDLIHHREFERALRKEEEDVKDMEQAMNQQLRLQQ
ncbi:MAG: hypothetical protein ACJ71J_11365 [Nitrososphaeraceae archaeon]